MVDKKIDRRINRTRRALREAMLSLILEKGYDAVTVDEIAERADVSRSTFYLHYRDKEDILLENLEATVDDLLIQFAGLPLVAWEAPPDPSGLAQPTPILLVFIHAGENIDLYRILLRGEGASRMQTHMRQIITSTVIDYLREKVAKESLTLQPVISLDVFANFFAGSLLGMITWWLENELPYPPEEMATMFQRLVFPGAQEVLGIAFP